MTIGGVTLYQGSETARIPERRGIYAWYYNPVEPNGIAVRRTLRLLLGQPGVEKVDGINLSGGGSTLPTDATQITLVVLNVPGLQGSPTPTGSPGLGTPTSTTSSPVSRPSPSSVPGK